MIEVLEGAVQALRGLLGAFDPETLDGACARRLVEAFAEVERLASAGKALAARQVAATGVWKRSGAYRDAADWLAATTGSTVGEARTVLDTAARVTDLPGTDAAFRAGELSAAQAGAIADAACADPGAEAHLLERAKHDGVRGLRDECTRVKAAALPDEGARYARIREQRSLRHWTDTDGTGRIDVRGPVDATARVLAALAPFERSVFDATRTDGRRERSDAIAFDALVAMADARAAGDRSGDGSAGGSGDRSGDGLRDGVSPRAGAVATAVVVRVDHSALVRGEVGPGEVCEIVGGGPIPVAVASRLLDDAFVKAVLVDGADVLAVSHLGRTIPARLRTALEELQLECCTEGCHVVYGLEIDHNLPVERGGPTALWNLNRLCSHHHDHKHRFDLRLVGHGVDQRFVPAKDWVPEHPP